MREKILINARIIDPSQGMDEKGSIIIGNNGKIKAIGKSVKKNDAESAEVIDIKNHIVIPGIVDIINSGLFASRMSKLKSFVRFLLFMISFAAIKRWWILCKSSGELSSFMALQTTGFFLRESASVVSLFYALLLSKMEMCLSLFHLSFWKVCIILKARSDFIYFTPKYFFISPECNFIDFLIFLATLVTDFSSSAVSSILLPCKVGLLYFN